MEKLTEKVINGLDKINIMLEIFSIIVSMEEVNINLHKFLIKDNLETIPFMDMESSNY